MREPAANAAAHGRAATGGTAATNSGLGRLDKPVDGFSKTLVEVGVEVARDPIEVVAERGAQPVERSQASAPCAADPRAQRRFRTGRPVVGREQVAPALLEAPGPGGLHPGMMQSVHVDELLSGPVAGVLQGARAHALEFGHLLDLRAPHLIQAGMRQRDHVEGIEADSGLEAVLPCSGDVRLPEVEAHIGDGLRLATMRCRVFGERGKRLAIAPGSSKQHPTLVHIAEQCQIALALARAALIGTDPADPRVAFLSPGRVDRVAGHPPHPAIGYAQQPHHCQWPGTLVDGRRRRRTSGHFRSH